jgi:ribosomal protein L37AE/L43A
MELDELTEYQSKTFETQTETYKCPECGRTEKHTVTWELIDSGE